MTTSRVPSQEADRQEVELRRLRAQLEILKREADKADIITAAVETPFWRVILEPLITEQVRAFQENEAWNTTGEDLVERRGKARRSLELRNHILKRVGKRPYYLKEAERIAAILEAASKERA